MSVEKKSPMFWKSTLEDIDNTVETLQQGRVAMYGRSAGSRPIYLIEYGKSNELKRTANFSSALGAKAPQCYAEKGGLEYRPTLFLVGGIHGGEFEGTVSILNLIRILETGRDFTDTEYGYLADAIKDCNLLLLPCANPDGRARIHFDSFVGRSMHDLRYYNQGTWKDGSLCGWPDCKKIHPIKEHAGYLGGYFNDDGINIMHDNFIRESSAETTFIMEATDRFAPDLIALLHGGDNTVNHILKPAYAPSHIKEQLLVLEKQLEKHYTQKRLDFRITPLDRGENDIPPASFNLTSALYHLCGSPCFTYESNQGLAEDGSMTYEEIYQGHLILFEEMLKFLRNGGDKNV